MRDEIGPCETCGRPTPHTIEAGDVTHFACVDHYGEIADALWRKFLSEEDL